MDSLRTGSEKVKSPPGATERLRRPSGVTTVQRLVANAKLASSLLSQMLLAAVGDDASAASGWESQIFKSGTKSI